MNRLNKILLSVLVVVACGFMTFVGTADASIKETVDANNTLYDHIENGTKIIGITKFNPNTILTAKRASQATMNDVAYNLNNPNYDGVHIYYYYYGWYEFDENNNSTPVSNPSVLNELNIFYVDNVEKKLSINYSGATNNLSFKTDKANKNREVSYANGVITVPATVKNLTVLSNNTPQITYAKVDESDMTFLENPTTGKLVAIDNSLNYLPMDSSIMFDGHIPFKITDNDIVPNGNYVSVGIVRNSNDTPEESDREKITFIVQDAANLEGTVYNWGVDNDDIMRQLDIMFSENIREATITVIWEKGNSETFKVSITNGTELEEIPEGKMIWDSRTGIATDEEGNELNFPVDSSTVKNTVIFSGVIGYVESGANSIAGNRVGVEITPNDKYKNTDTSKIGITVEGTTSEEDAVPTWDNGVIHFTPVITDTNRVITIKVTWEQGFTQVFTIDATQAFLQGPTI